MLTTAVKVTQLFRAFASFHTHQAVAHLDLAQATPRVGISFLTSMVMLQDRFSSINAPVACGSMIIRSRRHQTDLVTNFSTCMLQLMLTD